MDNSVSRIAIIPARGGSKRIPRKNIKLIKDRPAISYAIQTAQRAKLFEEIYVSTDDEEIAEIARNFGANTTIMRAPMLANDEATTIEVIADFLQNLPAGLIPTETSVSCIYPVVPLLKESRLQEAQEILEKNKFGYVFPILPLPVSPSRSFNLVEGKFIANVDQLIQKQRTQDLEPFFCDAGQFYSAFASTWMSRIPIFTPKSVGLKLNQWEVIDVDTPEDWSLMEQLVQIGKIEDNT